MTYAVIHLLRKEIGIPTWNVKTTLCMVHSVVIETYVDPGAVPSLVHLLS